MGGARRATANRTVPRPPGDEPAAQARIGLLVVLDPQDAASTGVAAAPVEFPDSAPSVAARVLAFVSVVVAGACGGLIGFAVIDLGCNGGCLIAAGLTGLAAATAAATGTAVVAVLVLRSSAEWRAGQGLPSAPGRSLE